VYVTNKIWFDDLIWFSSGSHLQQVRSLFMTALENLRNLNYFKSFGKHLLKSGKDRNEHSEWGTGGWGRGERGRVCVFEGECEQEGGRNIRDTAIEGKVIQRRTSLSDSPCFCCRLWLLFLWLSFSWTQWKVRHNNTYTRLSAVCTLLGFSLAWKWWRRRWS
jgi:hypothetical protein